MTPRERILATLNHEPPDRTPTEGWFHPEVAENLKAHYKTDRWADVLEELGIVGWASCEPWIAFPDSGPVVDPTPGAGSEPVGERMERRGQRTIESESVDAWGVRSRIEESGRYSFWIDGPLVTATSIDDIDEYGIPGPDRVGEPEDYAGKVQELKSQEMFTVAVVPNPFKIAWMLRGFENTLVDYVSNREFLEYLYDRHYALYGELTLRMARAGLDMIMVVGDFAMQDRLMLSPATWRAVDKPRLANLIANCRAVNPDVFFFVHSDGNLIDAIDDLIEIGFDVVNPIQPECVDPAEVKRRWGKKITLHGGISLQRTMPFGSTEDVRQEVETLIRKCGYDGGLVAFPSNIIQPDTPVENIITCFHTARDFDVASLGGRPG